ncbi:hypothetical protein [Oerskovia paurometabola]|uniref:Secreted protein n=1 Tax=Oerskovia paurometabola TaxID=162170 RepID=A0ABW1XI47_9CELL|nr:hypothetical protein [Oerskovia paurometabola]MBM7497517.1 hypothetical protein [Oerskovia paurometabola]
MTWSEIAIIVVAVVLVAGWALWVAASRLDRLHRKVMASRLALDAQLERRASAALDLAGAGELDPASSVLVAEAAYAVLDDDLRMREVAAAVPGLAELVVAPEGVRRPDGGAPLVQAPRLLAGVGMQRAMAESDLSATLRAALEDPQDVAEIRASPLGADLLAALGGAWYRAQIARRFHNEAVAQTQRLRRTWYARAFSLAGHAPMPVTVELDDAWPSGLDRNP